MSTPAGTRIVSARAPGRTRVPDARTARPFDDEAADRSRPCSVSRERRSRGGVDRREGSMSSKRQQTMAKTMREQALRERRAKKQEKKEAARSAKAARDPAREPTRRRAGRSRLGSASDLRFAPPPGPEHLENPPAGAVLDAKPRPEEQAGAQPCPPARGVGTGLRHPAPRAFERVVVHGFDVRRDRIPAPRLAYVAGSVLAPQPAPLAPRRDRARNRRCEGLLVVRRPASRPPRRARR